MAKATIRGELKKAGKGLFDEAIRQIFGVKPKKKKHRATYHFKIPPRKEEKKIRRELHFWTDRKGIKHHYWSYK